MIRRRRPMRRRPMSPTRRALERRTPLRARSASRAEFQRTVRAPLVAAMLAESPWCELDAPIREADPSWAGCRLRAEALHELRKRSAGGSLTNRANLRRACHPCNGWVEDHPLAARSVGLVVRPGDPGWDELGA